MAYVKEKNRVRYMQLATMKAAVKLEALGMKHSRGSVTKKVRTEFAIDAKVSKQQIVDFLQAEMDKLKE